MLSWVSKKTKLKKSYVFWLGIGFLVQIIIGFISFKLLVIISAIGSFITMGSIFDDDLRDNEFPWHIWFPITWLFIAIFGILLLIYLVIKKPINFILNQFERFNNKLNQD